MGQKRSSGSDFPKATVFIQRTARAEVRRVAGVVWNAISDCLLVLLGVVLVAGITGIAVNNMFNSPFTEFVKGVLVTVILIIGLSATAFLVYLITCIIGRMGKELK